jgi:type II secretory pathway component PulK
VKGDSIIKKGFGLISQTFLSDYKRRKEMIQSKGIFFYLRGGGGYVLIIVLLVVSLLVSVSSEFLITAQINVHYIRKFSEKLKAYTIARAGLNIAAAVLDADKKGVSAGMLQGLSTNTNTDSYSDLWAVDFPELPMEDGYLMIRIYDESAKINLSILANEVVDRTPYYAITQRFFLNMGLPMDMADALIDWVDIDDARFPYGAESADYYMTLPSPYRAKNAEMDSIQEMLMVKNITPEVYYGLGEPLQKESGLVDDNRGSRRPDTADLLKALPGEGKAASGKRTAADIKDLENPIGRERSRRLSDYFRVNGERTDYLSELNKININTASYRVLSALSDSMTDDIVTELIRRRQQQPFSSVDDVKDLIPEDTIRKNLLGVRSYIFRLEAAGRVRDTRTRLVAVYNRENRKYYYMSEQ